MGEGMAMRATNQQKHEAGRHFVVAEALLRGYDADTIGRSGLIEVNGHGTEIHVKVVGSWQISNIDKFRTATSERVVFIDLSGAVPEFFIQDGDHARAIIWRSHEAWLKGVGGRRPPSYQYTETGPMFPRGPNR